MTQRADTSSTPCDDGEVFVVVDAHELGDGDPIAACVAHADTGADVLEAAGFTVTGTTRFGRAMVCRIDDIPNAKRESCTNTPPATAYWSYWHAAPGECSWTYSQQGGVARVPEVDGAEGWSFALDADPGAIPPPRVDPCSQQVTLRDPADTAAAAVDTSDAGGDSSGRIDPVFGLALLAILIICTIIVRWRRGRDD